MDLRGTEMLSGNMRISQLLGKVQEKMEALKIERSRVAKVLSSVALKLRSSCQFKLRHNHDIENTRCIKKY